jgi:hypothetical protein
MGNCGLDVAQEQCVEYVAVSSRKWQGQHQMSFVESGWVWDGHSGPST